MAEASNFLRISDSISFKGFLGYLLQCLEKQVRITGFFTGSFYKCMLSEEAILFNQTGF